MPGSKTGISVIATTLFTLQARSPLMENVRSNVKGTRTTSVEVLGGYRRITIKRPGLFRSVLCRLRLRLRRPLRLLPLLQQQQQPLRPLQRGPTAAVIPKVTVSGRYLTVNTLPTTRTCPKPSVQITLRPIIILSTHSHITLNALPVTP